MPRRQDEFQQFRRYTSRMPSTLPDQVTLGLVQMQMSADPAENLKRAISRIREAAGKGAQVICLPELFQSRYFCQTEDHSFFQLAESIPGPATEKLGKLAGELGVV